MTHLWPTCREIAEGPEGLVIPFDMGDYRAILLWRATLLVGVIGDESIADRHLDLFLEQRMPSESIYERFDRATRAPSSEGMWFELVDPPELMDRNRRTHLLLASL